MKIFNKRRLKENPNLIKNKKKISFNLNFSRKIFAVSVVILILIFMFGTSFFKISGVDFKRTDLSFDPTEVQEKLSYLAGKNIFLISTSKIENKIEELYPRFKNIKISRIYPDRLSLEVKPYEDVFLIHTYFTELNQKTGFKEKFVQKFLISQFGELKNKEDVSGEDGEIALKNLFIKEDLQKELFAGEVFLEEDLIFKIQKAFDILTGFYEIRIEDIYFYPKAQELHFNSLSGDIWLTLTKDLNEQLDKISLFKFNLGEEKQVDYLDLRVSGKIIYKD